MTPGSVKTVIFTAGFPPAMNGGGPIQSAEALVKAAPAEFQAFVVTSNRDLGETDLLPVAQNQWGRHDEIPVYYVAANSIIEMKRVFASIRLIAPDIVHFNSFFSPRFTILPLIVWRLGYWGRPKIILSPSGEFGVGALSRRTFKKRIYISLFRLFRFDRSVIWHSTAEHESADIRRLWGNGAKIVYRENYTSLPEDPQVLDSVPETITKLAFLGRIVEHKGLEVVLEALADSSVPLTLNIYGPEEDSEYVLRCRNLASQLPKHITTQFWGVLNHNQVLSELSHHDALLMPTAGENFGHVIAEALSVCCPVLVTPHTPWTQIIAGGGGVVVKDRNSKNWKEQIEKFALLSVEERIERRHAAGEAYLSWRLRPQDPHVWTLALNVEK